MRRLLILASVLVVSAIAGRTALGAPPAACAKAEIKQHDEAVFGHFATRGEALALAARARKVGFQGIKIEDEGCGDFEVEIDGADTGATRDSFAREAHKAGFEVTFEQTGPPMQPPSGQVVGVFARLGTVTKANTLAGKLAATGFRYIDIVRVGKTWAVVMPQVPTAHALSIAAEVHRAGYRIAFVTS